MDWHLPHYNLPQEMLVKVTNKMRVRVVTSSKNDAVGMVVQGSLIEILADGWRAFWSCDVCALLKRGSPTIRLLPLGPPSQFEPLG